MLANLQNIPYLNRVDETNSDNKRLGVKWQTSKVEMRDSHAIAEYVSEYLSEEQVYYIEFFNSTAVNRANASDFISGPWLNRIRKGETKIAFHNIHEGFHNVSTSVLKFCLRHDIPTEHCIIISSNYDIRQYCERACVRLQTPMPRIILCDVFEIQASRLLNHFISDRMMGSLEAFNETTRDISKTTHHYLNLNRRQRAHRPMLVHALIARDLHLKGKVSLGSSDFDENMEEIMLGVPNYWLECPDVRTQIFQNRTKIEDTLPLYLDTPDLVTNRAMSKLTDVDLYTSTMLSVVSETTFFSHHSLNDTRSWEPGVFLSEKTWKPVIHLQPWIMVSQPFTQEVIRDKGYQTFGEFIDESYDYEESDTHRMYMILRLIEQICRWTPERITEFQLATQEICYHNQDVLLQKVWSGNYFKELT